jgi:hypothetical protein
MPLEFYQLLLLQVLDINSGNNKMGVAPKYYRIYRGREDVAREIHLKS